MTKLRAVVFDLDGLMFNTEELYQYCGTEILARRGKKFEADLINAMMGRPAASALQLMIDWHQLSDQVETLQAETTEIFSEILEDQLRTMPGLLELLTALELAKIPKAIATSSPRFFTQNVLKPFRLEPRFEFLLCSEDITDGKPHPEIYLTAAQRLNIASDEMMVLEDSQTGCRAAILAKAFTVAVPSGISKTHDFTGTALIAETLADSRIYEALEIESVYNVKDGTTPPTDS